MFDLLQVQSSVSATVLASNKAAVGLQFETHTGPAVEQHVHKLSSAMWGVHVHAKYAKYILKCTY